MNPSDRAALQGLIPLAGALGAGTIFALFFGGRRKAGFAVFEVFVVVAVLSAVATTAYFCIALLHRNEPITDHELTQTATPLIVAVFFLGLVSIGARIPGSIERAAPILGIALIGAGAAAWLASSAWTATPEDASLVAVAILAAGALLGTLAWGVDRVNTWVERRWEHRHFERLVRLGYTPAGGSLGLALPRREEDGPPQLSYWTRDGRAYFDFETLRNLRDQADDRWYALSTGKARLPGDCPALLRIELSRWLSGVSPKRPVGLVTVMPGGEQQSRQLTKNADGLFEVS